MVAIMLGNSGSGLAGMVDLVILEVGPFNDIVFTFAGHRRGRHCPRAGCRPRRHGAARAGPGLFGMDILGGHGGWPTVFVFVFCDLTRLLLLEFGRDRSPRVTTLSTLTSLATAEAFLHFADACLERLELVGSRVYLVLPVGCQLFVLACQGFPGGAGAGSDTPLVDLGVQICHAFVNLENIHQFGRERSGNGPTAAH